MPELKKNERAILDISKFIPSGYLTYDSGVDQSMPRYKENEVSTYQCEPIEIRLPPKPKEAILKAVAVFQEIDPKDYNFLSQNCAQASLQFLKAAGYVGESTKVLRPKALAQLANQVVLNYINKQRENILKEYF